MSSCGEAEQPLRLTPPTPNSMLRPTPSLVSLCLTPRPSTLPPHEMSAHQEARVCTSVCVLRFPNVTAIGTEGQKPSLSCWSHSAPSPPLFFLCSFLPANTKECAGWGLGVAHITSSLRVKDRPQAEWLLRVALSNHIACDYTLCHLCADLTPLHTDRNTITHDKENMK